MTFFGAAWSDLAVEDVAAFLEEAEDEPLLWEAKGTQLDAHHVRRAVCGFANSHEGGYLILGAARQDGAWVLDGLSFPTEAAVWIDSVVGDGLRPRPRIDVRAFPVGGDRHVAVVRVDPIPTPPCIARGTVFERVPGRTVAVKDPTRLADLFRRGDQAHELALARARRMRRVLTWDGRDHPMYKAAAVQVALCASTTAYPDDLSARLFHDEFRTTLLEARETHLGAGVPENFVQSRPGMQQDIHYLETEAPTGEGFGRGWLLKGRWDGSVGIYFVGSTDTTRNASLCGEIIGPAWAAAVELLGALGGFGPAYVALAVWGSGHPLNRFVLSAAPDGPEPGTLLDRGPIELDAAALDLRSIERELDRALGHDSYEPER